MVPTEATCFGGPMDGEVRPVRAPRLQTYGVAFTDELLVRLTYLYELEQHEGEFRFVYKGEAVD